MYGLPQAGILANKLLKKRLARYGYFELPHTPGLWKHVSRPIAFTLVVDDFGIKYVGKEHIDHLLNAIKTDYTVDVDMTGGSYVGIKKLAWNYEKRYVGISMPDYVQKQLVRYGHSAPSRKQYSPYDPAPFVPGKASQELPPLVNSEKLDKKGSAESNKVWGASSVMTTPSI